MKKPLNILQLVNVRWYNACAHYAVALSSGLQKRGHQVILAGDHLFFLLSAYHRIDI